MGAVSPPAPLKNPISPVYPPRKVQNRSFTHPPKFQKSARLLRWSVYWHDAPRNSKFNRIVLQDTNECIDALIAGVFQPRDKKNPECFQNPENPQNVFQNPGIFCHSIFPHSKKNHGFDVFFYLLAPRSGEIFYFRSLLKRFRLCFLCFSLKLLEWQKVQTLPKPSENIWLIDARSLIWLVS